MSLILGIHFGSHDSAAALLSDGEILAAAEEERFVGIKHAPTLFPKTAAEFCLAQAGVSPADIDCVAYSVNPWCGLMRSALFSAVRPRTFGPIEFIRRLQMFTVAEYSRRFIALPRTTPVRGIPHHDAHAASAFFASPFEDAAVVIMDGIGEWVCTTVYRARGKSLENIYSISFPHSVGFVYASVTDYLGFRPVDSEWKVMGLAPYGSPDHLPLFRSVVRSRGAGRYRVDTSYFRYQRDWAATRWYSEKLVRALGPARADDEELNDRHKAVAASLQARTSEVVHEVVRHAREVTASRHLCLAGGVAQNSALNGELALSGLFERMFVQPVSDDAGTAIGAAQYVAHAVLGKPRGQPMRHTYLGPEFDDATVRSVLSDCGLRFRVADPAREAAERLSRGQVVGWFQGRMEFGPRALGNRSILADPRDPSMKDRINRAVKYREGFRPFAPSVLAERAGEFFSVRSDAPFMTMVAPVLPEKRSIIPAVTHVDGTARLQTVRAEVNPRFSELIRHFHDLTGVPVVLNTSLNVRGKPIACTPRDALATFYASGMDALIIGDCILDKRDESRVG